MPYFGKNPHGFFIVGVVAFWLSLSSPPTLPFMPYFGKNPHGFFIGGAVYIWVISDFTSTLASPFSPDKALSGIKGEVART